MQPAGILRTPHPFGQYRMISLSHLLSIRARSPLPLSQEQGSIDTETVATTRFAAHNCSLLKLLSKNQLGERASSPNKSNLFRFYGSFRVFSSPFRRKYMGTMAPLAGTWTRFLRTRFLPGTCQALARHLLNCYRGRLRSPGFASGGRHNFWNSFWLHDFHWFVCDIDASNPQHTADFQNVSRSRMVD